MSKNKLSEIHDESGPMPNFVEYVRNNNELIEKNGLVFFGSSIPKKVKCQKPGCGKILSAPTNHRCDLCYCYYQ